jgi:hypothetical protein
MWFSWHSQFFAWFGICGRVQREKFSNDWKKVSNGWKIFFQWLENPGVFSNDWKNFSAVFQ